MEGDCLSWVLGDASWLKNVLFANGDNWPESSFGVNSNCGLMIPFWPKVKGMPEVLGTSNEVGREDVGTCKEIVPAMVEEGASGETNAGMCPSMPLVDRSGW
jgi:hypothetical protein